MDRKTKYKFYMRLYYICTFQNVIGDDKKKKKKNCGYADIRLYIDIEKNIVFRDL